MKGKAYTIIVVLQEDIMSLISIYFVLFFFFVLAVYYILPLKYRNIWLLFSSYIFYIEIGSFKSVYFIVGVTVLTYMAGVLLKHVKDKRFLRKLILIVNVICVVMLLVYFRLLAKGMFHINMDIIMPIGISFFTLQAIGYCVDIYKGKIDAELNFIKYALFLNLFIYILSGPIERAGNIIPQMNQKEKINYKRICHGLQLMLWGFFVKSVVGERLAIVVNNVYGDYTYYSGIELLIAVIAYSLYIYCDFSAYSNIALGGGEALGFNIIQNFKQPYFSKSISEFWRRWHISLSTWLKDYIYIPMGGGRVKNISKYRNILIVFLVSGLWHGMSWGFVVWGMIHAFYQIIGNIFLPVRRKIISIFSINTNSFSYKLFQAAITFILVSFAWIFFYFDNVSAALVVIKRVFLGFSISGTFGINAVPEFAWRNVIGENLVTSPNHMYWSLGLDIDNIFILLISLIILLMVDILNYKGFKFREWMEQQNIFFRWLIYLGGIFAVMTYGVYGASYSASSFIYSNF